MSHLRTLMKLHEINIAQKKAISLKDHLGSLSCIFLDSVPQFSVFSLQG